MDLKKVLGFSLEPVRIHPDGASTPPDISPLSPPSEPVAAPRPHLLDATRIEGLAPPPAPPQAPAPSPAQAPPRAPASSTSTEVTAPSEEAAPHSPEPQLAASSTLGTPSALRHRRIALLAIGSLLVGFTAAVLVSRRDVAATASSNAAAESPGSSTGASAPGWQEHSDIATTPCARQREPRRLATGISPTFPLEGSSIAGSVEVLVGAASAANVAVGFKLNATTLEATEILHDTGQRELLGVVPAATHDPPTFVVDRAGVGGYRDWRTLPNQSVLGLGRTNRGIHLVRRGEQRSVPLWSLGAEEELSRPRVEQEDADRVAVALRRGGRHGTIVIGWLDPQSLQHSTLRELPLEGREVGLPSLAVHERRAAVAVAVRASTGAPWRIQVATSEWYGRSARIALPDLHSRPEQDTFAPSLVELDDARWFLQWTEGQQGERRVRAITLDADFVPLGDPIDVSTTGANAGGGLVVPVDQGLISLFLVQRGNAYELWATTLACI